MLRSLEISCVLILTLAQSSIFSSSLYPDFLWRWDAAATCVVTTENAIESEKFRRDLEFARQLFSVLPTEIL